MLSFIIISVIIIINPCAHYKKNNVFRSSYSTSLHLCIQKVSVITFVWMSVTILGDPPAGLDAPWNLVEGGGVEFVGGLWWVG